MIEETEQEHGADTATEEVVLDTEQKRLALFDVVIEKDTKAMKPHCRSAICRKTRRASEQCRVDTRYRFQFIPTRNPESVFGRIHTDRDERAERQGHQKVWRGCPQRHFQVVVVGVFRGKCTRQPRCFGDASCKESQMACGCLGDQ